MAILHQATLTPSKAELVGAWLPAQDWYDGPEPVTPRPVASFRFDDPAGEVGIETMLVRADDDDATVWQVPMTYRATPLEGADGHLIGVLEHSVLGTRYVYDATGDPVYRDVLRAVIVGRGREADLTRVLSDGSTEVADKTMTVHGTGGTGGLDGEIDVLRRPEPASERDASDGTGMLIGVLTDQPPLTLARLT